jgi:predicted acetyltransferase
VDLQIRPITSDEVPAWVETMRVGFLGHAAEGEAEHRRAQLDLTRTLGGFDGSQVVGTLRSFTTEMAVPGGSARCAALTNVTVAATHRRRGLLTALLTRDLEESVARGEIVGALIAAEYPIYGRFGYGPAVDGVDLELSDRVRLTGDPDQGRVEFLSGPELRSLAPAIYERVKADAPGAIGRLPHVWDYQMEVAE